MKIYIVCKEGIFIQDILGVFDDLDEAETCAVLAMDKEKDDYHEMVVIEMPLNKKHDNPETKIIVSRKNSIIRTEHI